MLNSPHNRLNPFCNQVVVPISLQERRKKVADSLNPFCNQVFVPMTTKLIESGACVKRLNPFCNQVFVPIVSDMNPPDMVLESQSLL